MTAIWQAALAAVIATMFLPGALQAEEAADTAEKTVRLAWFPRFSPDGKWLLSAHGSWNGMEGGEARLWNVEDGKIVHVLKRPRGVRSVAWSPAGTFFVTGSYCGAVRFFEPRTGKSQGELQLGGSVEGVRITSGDNRLVTTHGNGDVRVIELRPGPAGSREHRHSGPVLGYVLEGRVRFGVNHEPERILGVGETFFEETGALHSAFGSADQTRARVLVFMVVPRGTNGEA